MADRTDLFIREAWSFPDRPTQGRSKRSLSDPRPAQAPRMETEWPRMTVDSLKDCNKKYLAQLAKDQGIVGWHAMRKDQLIRALAAPQATLKKAPGKAAVVDKAKAAEDATAASRRAAAVPVVSRPIPVLRPRALNHACVKDQIVTVARDPYWLHTYWELSRSTLARAQAALGQEWHTARPILRLMDVTSEDTTSASERHIRDIEIHGGVNNWFIDVQSSPRSYRIDIGYLARRGKFFVLARSNVVTTPKAGTSDIFDEGWSNVQEQFQRLYRQSGGANGSADAHDLRDLFEERFRRPMHSLSLQSLGTGALTSFGRDFHFEIDAELIVYGTTEPNAKVTLQGEPVQVRPDGSFTVRFSLPDSRQIIPAVAASPDGVEERTIVLAVERNTKELEPMIHDGNEL
jgi:uncharacterized protein